jgi:hypothetical protein
VCVCCRGLLFFGVVVLIGTGWSYMKPFIDDRTRQVLMIVIPLQVCGWAGWGVLTLRIHRVDMHVC